MFHAIVLIEYFLYILVFSVLNWWWVRQKAETCSHSLLVNSLCPFDVHGTVHHKRIPLSITNKMQRYTIFLLLSMLYMFRAVSPPIIRSSNCIYSIWYMSGLLAAIAGVGELELIHASKPDIDQMLCVQFLSSWWWAEKPPEIYRALTAIRILYNVASCWLYLNEFVATDYWFWN